MNADLCVTPQTSGMSATTRDKDYFLQAAAKPKSHRQLPRRPKVGDGA